MSSLNRRSSSASKFSVDEGNEEQNRDVSAASSKLDVMSSKQFNRLTFLNIGLILYTILHVVFIITACNTAWLGTFTVNGIHGGHLTIETCNAPRYFMVPLYLLDISGRICLIILSLFFVIRIVRTTIRRSTEQIWSVIMVVMTALSYNPFLAILILHDNIINVTNVEVWWAILYPWLNDVSRVNRAISLSIA